MDCHPRAVARKIDASQAKKDLGKEVTLLVPDSLLGAALAQVGEVPQLLRV